MLVLLGILTAYIRPEPLVRYALALLMLLLLGMPSPRSASGQAVVSAFNVFEGSLLFSKAMANTWTDAKLVVTFIRPNGSTVTIDGFFYDTGIWKFRYAPDTPGSWRWTAKLTSITGTLLETSNGSLTVGPLTHSGFLKVKQGREWAQLVQSDDSPFPVFGLGDCLIDVNRDGRIDMGSDLGEPISQEPGERYTDLNTYAAMYGNAGFNMFRFSVDNCSFGLYSTVDPAGNRYLVSEGKQADEVIATLRNHGFRIYFVLFGFSAPFQLGSSYEQREAVSNYVRYIVARYGAMVDVWELMNEIPDEMVDAEYIANLVATLREADPYQHPISTSFEQPDNPLIDIVSPHFYAPTEVAQSVDLTLIENIEKNRRSGKPLIYGEYGNQGSNWDEQSSIRMRIQSWTALFEGTSLMWWNTSATTSYKARAGNIYLGPEERQSLRAIRDFSAQMGTDLRRYWPVDPAPPGVRWYGLQDATRTYLYIHHAASHLDLVAMPVNVQLDSPKRLRWVRPSSNETIATRVLPAGRNELVTPQFQIDLVAVFEPVDLGGIGIMTTNVAIGPVRLPGVKAGR